MIKYVYPEREEDERQDYQRENSPVIHSNVSTYAQALMDFHEENPVPTHHSNKRLKMQFSEQTPMSKRDTPKELSFIDTDDPAPAEDQYRKQPTFDTRTSNQKEGRGQDGRDGMGKRGGQGGRGSSGRNKQTSKDPVPLPHPWRNEVNTLIREMRVDIMKEIKLVITTAISSQISEITKAMATEIQTAISMEMSTHTPMKL